MQVLIAQLGDDQYEKREAAYKKLAAIGEPAMELLRKAAADSPDPEVRERADRLLAEVERQLFRLVSSVRGHDQKSRRIALTADGTRFVSAGVDGMCMGASELGAPVVYFGTGPRQFYWSVAVSADGKRVIAGALDRFVRVFDLTKGRQVQELAGNAEVWGVALLRDGKRAVTGTKDKSLQLWDVDSGKQLGIFEGVGRIYFAIHAGL